ncbi:MAG: 4Fe-4S binding protein [Chitinivibrionales bacterium]|nr:4Fe-4S binding protein [Chitinivibrionales bacterium]
MRLRVRNFGLPAAIAAIFATATTIMWFATHKKFFLFDLPFIGFSIVLGLVINIIQDNKFPGVGRKVTQFLVGFYFLFFLNFFMKANMQIEGFFFQTFTGFFNAAFLHYSIAKLFGPALFGRGFCGWACWSAMVFDLLPFSKSPGRIRRLGALRYFHLCASAAMVSVLSFQFNIYPKTGTDTSIVWFVCGNIAYYTVGVALAYALKDNRAFCKYVCPIVPLQKLLGSMALFKIRINTKKCIRCGRCEKNCPMDIKLLDYAAAGTRVLSNECIFCDTCASACPRGAVLLTTEFDLSIHNRLRYRNDTNEKV